MSSLTSPEHRAAARLTSTSRQWLYLVLIVLYAGAVAGYVGLRFDWRWLGGDALALTRLSENVFLEETLTPRSGAYFFGYAYPAWNTFLAHVTGLPVATVQNLLQPFLVMLLVPTAYITFRALTEDRTVAALAVLLLFLQPEFLFETVRSSHAKLTWLFALTVLYLLARSVRREAGTAGIGRWVLLFYLVALGLLTSSIYFGSSYIAGIVFAFLATRLLPRLPGRVLFRSPVTVRRLSYVTATSLILVFLVMFYLYPPALFQLQSLNHIIDQVSSLFLGTEDTSTNPYAYVGRAWNSAYVYLILTSLNYLVLLLSFGAWLRFGWQILVHRQAEISAPRLLLWLFYTSFASLLALSIVLDVAGVLSSNMQVRLFPHLMVVAIPLASIAVVDALRAFRNRRAVYRTALAVLVLSIPLFSAFSLIKMTNDPAVGNHWVFHTRQERQALEWADNKLLDTTVWVGPDNRLQPLVQTEMAWSARKVWMAYQWDDQTRYALLSDVILARSARMEETVPDVYPRLRVYDNGSAWYYYRRPATPYQR